MKGFKVDFDEVRLKDASLKKRYISWSGQDVLEESMNKDLAMYATTFLNKARIWPKLGLGLVKKVRFVLKVFVRTALFENLMTFSVLWNTVVMALDRYGNDEETEAKLDFYNLVFTWVFIAEMALKLLAVGPRKYVAEPMNLLDGSCVLISIFELILFSSEGGGALSAVRTARVFRTFRVLRVARLLRFMRSMALIVGVILRSL